MLYFGTILIDRSAKTPIGGQNFNSKLLFIVNAGLFSEEKVSRDENIRAAVEDAPSSKKFLLFN
jgi:hypothetical protein